jgi:hypothetical protein
MDDGLKMIVKKPRHKAFHWSEIAVGSLREFSVGNPKQESEDSLMYLTFARVSAVREDFGGVAEPHGGGLRIRAKLWR